MATSLITQGVDRLHCVLGNEFGVEFDNYINSGECVELTAIAQILEQNQVNNQPANNNPVQKTEIHEMPKKVSDERGESPSKTLERSPKPKTRSLITFT